MYTISSDVDKHLIHIELEGFLSPSDFEAFMTDEKAALAKLKCRVGKHICCVISPD